MRKRRQWVGGDGFGAILRVDAKTAAGGWAGWRLGDDHLVGAAGDASS